MFLTISLYASLACVFVNPGFMNTFQMPCWSLNSIAHAPHVPGTPSGQCLPRLPSHSIPFFNYLTVSVTFGSLALALLEILSESYRHCSHRPFLKQKRATGRKWDSTFNRCPLLPAFQAYYKSVYPRCYHFRYVRIVLSE